VSKEPVREDEITEHYPPTMIRPESTKPFSKFKDFLGHYGRGCKLLYTNYMTSRRLKLKYMSDPTVLPTRRELLFLNTTTSDLIRGIPFLLLFMLPVVGYAALPYALLCPRLMATTFWTQSQVKRFFISDATHRYTLLRSLSALLDDAIAREKYSVATAHLSGHQLPTQSNKLFKKMEERQIYQQMRKQTSGTGSYVSVSEGNAEESEKWIEEYKKLQDIIAKILIGEDVPSLDTLQSFVPVFARLESLSLTFDPSHLALSLHSLHQAPLSTSVVLFLAHLPATVRDVYAKLKHRDSSSGGGGGAMMRAEQGEKFNLLVALAPRLSLKKMMNKAKKHACLLTADDHLLLREQEAIAKLSVTELVSACHARGLPAVRVPWSKEALKSSSVGGSQENEGFDHSKEMVQRMREELTAWVAMTTAYPSASYHAREQAMNNPTLHMSTWQKFSAESQQLSQAINDYTGVVSSNRRVIVETENDKKEKQELSSLQRSLLHFPPNSTLSTLPVTFLLHAGALTYKDL